MVNSCTWGCVFERVVGSKDSETYYMRFRPSWYQYNRDYNQSEGKHDDGTYRIDAMGVIVMKIWEI